MTQMDKWLLGCSLVMAFGTLAALAISVWALNKTQEVKVEQPVSVTITEELHDLFAGKQEMERHMAENRDDHDKIFKRIGGMERGVNEAIEGKVDSVRRDVMEVSNQVSSLKATTDMQNAQLARMDSKLDRLAERPRA